MFSDIKIHILKSVLTKKCKEDISNNRLRYLETKERVNVSRERQFQRIAQQNNTSTYVPDENGEISIEEAAETRKKIYSPYVKDNLDKLKYTKDNTLVKKKYIINTHKASIFERYRRLTFKEGIAQLDAQINNLAEQLNLSRQDYDERISILESQYDRFKTHYAIHNAEKCIEEEARMLQKYYDKFNDIRHILLLLVSEEEKMINKANAIINSSKAKALMHIDMYYNIISEIEPNIFLLNYTDEDYNKISGFCMADDYTNKRSETERRRIEFSSEENMPHLSIDTI